MKSLPMLFAMAILCNSRLVATDIQSVLRVGDGDPNLLAWMNSSSPEKLTLWVYTGAVPLPEYHLSSEEIEHGSLRQVYPNADGRLLYGFELQHCYPLGEGHGFLRRTFSVLRDPAVQAGRDIYVAKSEIVLLEAANGGLKTKVVSEDYLANLLNLEHGARFLGKLDNIVYYWNREDPENFFGRDLQTGRSYRWHVPGVYSALGVLRGDSGAIDFVAYRKIHGIVANEHGEQTLIPASFSEAVITDAVTSSQTNR